MSQDMQTIQRLQEALEQAKAKINEQDAFIEQILEPALGFGVVVEVGSKESILAAKDGYLNVKTPPKVKIQPGDLVTCAPGTNQIIEVSAFQPLGAIQHVKKLVDNKMVEITGSGDATLVVFTGRLAGKLAIGDRVLLDGSGTVVIRNLGQEEPPFQFDGTTGVSWNDIGGLELAKEQMQEAIEMPFKYKDVYKKYNKKPIKGVLLYGPPGCGKTMLAKASATAVRKLHEGAGAATGYIYIKGPEILERWVGVAEATIRNLFAAARKHKEKHGYPAILFIDEADAILRKRGSGISSDMESTIVPAFLSEMDGLEDSGAIVILATNRPDVLDNAITRNGRIDRAIKIDRPTERSSPDIFKIHLKGVPLCDISPSEVAKHGTKELFCPNRKLYQFGKKDGSSVDFNLGHLANGAMIAGIIDQATSLAMKRDFEGVRRDRSGVRLEDVTNAVDMIFKNNVDLNHRDELSDFLEPIKSQLDEQKVFKLRQSDAA